MISNINERFTKWYIKRGYRFGYDFDGVQVVEYGPLKIPLDIPESQFTCPWWVKPLLIFFSPSVYCVETTGRWFNEGFVRGLNDSLKEKERGW